MTDDLNQLRAVAEAATPGPWGWRHFGNDPETACRIVTYDAEPWMVVADEIWTPADAEFVATFDPPTVLALLDRAERAETERDEWKRRADEERESGGKAFRELVTVIKETEAEWLKDSDALDALRAAVTNLADEWQTEGITCECGHYVGTDHNSLGCYGVVTYTPLVRCSCKLTDNQDADDIAAARLRSLLAAAPTETEGENT